MGHKNNENRLAAFNGSTALSVASIPTLQASESIPATPLQVNQVFTKFSDLQN